VVEPCRHNIKTETSKKSSFSWGLKESGNVGITTHNMPRRTTYKTFNLRIPQAQRYVEQKQLAARSGGAKLFCFCSTRYEFKVYYKTFSSCRNILWTTNVHQKIWFKALSTFSKPPIPNPRERPKFIGLISLHEHFAKSPAEHFFGHI